ncbi:MAG: c-type cytochrome [Sulfurimonas sp.]
MKTANISSMVKGLVLVGVILASSSAMASADLYKKCAGCHGQHGERKAMGKSQVINTFTADEIVTALKGYKAGTYGGAMKGLMKGQVSKLDDKQIDSLGKYISTLK